MHTVIPWWAENALVVALLAPVVWLGCRLLRSRPAAQHLLWLLLLLKLLWPPIFPSALPVDSLAWLPKRAESTASSTAPPLANATVGTSVADPAASVHETVAGRGSAVADPAVRPDVREHTAIARHEDVAGFGGDEGDAGAGPDVPLLLAVPPAATAEVARQSLAAAFPLDRTWETAATALWWAWLAGCILAAVLTLRRLRSIHRLVRRAQPASEALTASVAATARRLRMRPVAARLLGGMASPLVVCLDKPRLLWPAERADAASLARLQPVLAHELAHVRRRDHWVAWLEVAAGLACWWNPVFWFVRRQLRETREMACDALALAETGDARGYADLLLEMTTGLSVAKLPAPMVGAGSPSRASLHRRLTMLFHDRVTARVSTAGGCAALVLAAVLLPGWTVGQEPGNLPELPTASTAADESPATDPANLPPLPKASAQTLNDSLAAEGTSEGATSSAVTPPAAGTSDLRVFPLIGVQALPAADPATEPPTGANAGVAHRSDDGTRYHVSADGVHQEMTLHDGRVLRITTAEDGRMTVGILRDGLLEERFEIQVLGPRSAVPTPAQPGRATGVLDGAASALVRPGAADAAADTSSRELLQIECSLAEVNLEEKEIEYELAAQAAGDNPDQAAAGRLKLLSLAVRKAELELARCRARLAAEERSDERSAAPSPNAASSNGRGGFDRLGVSLEAVCNVDSAAAPQFARGVKIVSVGEESLGAQAGWRAGDVLVGLHHWEIASLENLDYALANAPPGGPLAYYILRDGQLLRGNLPGDALNVRSRPATGAR